MKLEVLESFVTTAISTMHLFRFQAQLEGNFFRCVRARAHLRALMTRKSCVVRIAVLRNHLNIKELKLSAKLSPKTLQQKQFVFFLIPTVTYLELNFLYLICHRGTDSSDIKTYLETSFKSEPVQKFCLESEINLKHKGKTISSSHKIQDIKPTRAKYYSYLSPDEREKISFLNSYHV